MAKSIMRCCSGLSSMVIAVSPWGPGRPLPLYYNSGAVWARCRFWGLPCQDLLRRRAAHADAVRNADALVGVARHVQAGDLRQTRFQFGLARGMSDRVLRHGEIGRAH